MLRSIALRNELSGFEKEYTYLPCTITLQLSTYSDLSGVQDLLSMPLLIDYFHMPKNPSIMQWSKDHWSLQRVDSMLKEREKY